MSMTDTRPFPRGMLAAGRVVHRLLSIGIPLGPLHLLRTRGRHTGRAREVPVAVLRTGNRSWLVSPFGSVAWVLNVRANGEAHLRRGATVRHVRLEEVRDDRIPAILRTYRRRFAAVPFVRAAFHATSGSSLESFHREARAHPVFLIERGPRGERGA